MEALDLTGFVGTGEEPVTRSPRQHGTICGRPWLCSALITVRSYRLRSSFDIATTMEALGLTGFVGTGEEPVTRSPRQHGTICGRPWLCSALITVRSYRLRSSFVMATTTEALGLTGFVGTGEEPVTRSPRQHGTICGRPWLCSALITVRSYRLRSSFVMATTTEALGLTGFVGTGEEPVTRSPRQHGTICGRPWLCSALITVRSYRLRSSFDMATTTEALGLTGFVGTGEEPSD